MCGSRHWPWPATVEAVLDRLAARHHDRLVVIEGAATGADRAAHLWCRAHGLGADRHRCHPVDWEAERHTRPTQWRSAAGSSPRMR
ncbi:SLOG family protein [Streptomyces fulvoviolaceus]|uniref:SLOG family protein n=1 Tax=Streptomyces fulvoviolaceus TaxID=285535 RepID=UPI003B82DB84